MVTNGIDFVIGGKNQAAPALASTEKGLSRLEAGTKSLKTATTSLMASMAPLLAVLAAVKTVMAAVGGVKAANEAYDAQTESIKKLNSTLAIRGAQGASAGMQQVAKDLEKLTGVSDQTTLALMQQAQSMGFATGAMDDAAKAALGLAAATGKTADQSLGDMKAALEGNFESFHGLNPQIMFMRTNQEKLAAVLAIANQGLAQQAADTTSVAGSGRRADTAMGTLMETFGAIIAPIRVLISAGLQQLAETLTGMMAPAAEYATSVLENIGPIMDYVKEKVVQGINVVIGAFTFLEVILTNLGTVWDLVLAYAEKTMLGIVGAVMHALTEVIPAYAMWFGENFVNLIRDGLVLAFTVVTNHIAKIVDAFQALWDFIASGGQTDVLGELGNIAGRSYLEGFQSSLTALPEIAARQLSQREQDLADKVGKIGAKLGNEFSDKMEDRMVGVGSTISDEMSAATSNINLKGKGAVMTQGIPATEGRLLTRGPGTRIPELMQQILNELKKKPDKADNRNGRPLVQLDPQGMGLLQAIATNTGNTLQMEAIV
jgi:hypothetical protein